MAKKIAEALDGTELTADAAEALISSGDVAAAAINSRLASVVSAVTIASGETVEAFWSGKWWPAKLVGGKAGSYSVEWASGDGVDTVVDIRRPAPKSTKRKGITAAEIVELDIVMAIKTAAKFKIGQTVKWKRSGKVARLQGMSGKIVTGKVIKVDTSSLTVEPDFDNLGMKCAVDFDQVL